MRAGRILAAAVVLTLCSGAAVAEDGWVGEVFFGWGDSISQVRSMAELDGDFYAGTYKANGANIYVRAVTPPWVPSAIDGFGSSPLKISAACSLTNVLNCSMVDVSVIVSPQACG